MTGSNTERTPSRLIVFDPLRAIGHAGVRAIAPLVKAFLFLFRITLIIDSWSSFRGPGETLCRTIRTRNPGPGHFQRRGRQPHLSRLFGGPARAVPRFGQGVRRDGRRGGAPPHYAVRPLPLEIRRLPAADPPPGRQGFRSAKAALAGAATRTRRRAQI